MQGQRLFLCCSNMTLGCLCDSHTFCGLKKRAAPRSLQALKVQAVMQELPSQQLPSACAWQLLSRKHLLDQSKKFAMTTAVEE